MGFSLQLGDSSLGLDALSVNDRTLWVTPHTLITPVMVIIITVFANIHTFIITITINFLKGEQAN